MMTKEERENVYSLIVKNQKDFEKNPLQEGKAKPFAIRFFENMNKLLQDYGIEEIEVDIETLTCNEIQNAVEGFSYRLASLCESSMNYVKHEPIKKEIIGDLVEEIKGFINEQPPEDCHYEIDESERGMKLSYAQQFDDPSYLF